jgi:hypothetical protein
MYFYKQLTAVLSRHSIIVTWCPKPDGHDIRERATGATAYGTIAVEISYIYDSDYLFLRSNRLSTH